MRRHSKPAVMTLVSREWDRADGTPSRGQMSSPQNSPGMATSKGVGREDTCRQDALIFHRHLYYVTGSLERKTSS
jgi:hypothetical protein